MKKIRKNACKKLVRIGREMQDYILRNAGTKYYITHVRNLLTVGPLPKDSSPGTCRQGVF